jgi:hypothetical protein
VTFSVSVENTSVEAVTLTGLSDDVFGDLLDGSNPNVSSNTCVSIDTALSIGETVGCSFDAVVTGDAGEPDHLDTVTATVQDDDGNSGTGYDSATVAFTDVTPSVSVTKSPSVASIAEPGGVVTFDLMLRNHSSEDVIVVSLVDDVFGDLLDPFNPNVVDNTCELLPATMLVDGVFACSFDALLVGSATDPDHVNTVTFTVRDDEANEVDDTDDALVAFDDVAPTAVVTKTPSVGTVTEPGGTVVFTVAITSTSVEELSIDSVTDDVFGDLMDGANPNVAANTCVSLPAAVAPDETVECSFEADVAGSFGDPDHLNVVTVVLSDDEGTAIDPADDAAVSFAPGDSTASGLVFEDLDLDGVRDPSEVGLEGVVVVVTDSGGSPTPVATAADGTWSASVLPGAVTIEVDGSTTPSGYDLTTGNATQVLNALIGEEVLAWDIG